MNSESEIADHEFEGWGAHEGLGPCQAPRDWCHADCGIPMERHPAPAAPVAGASDE